MNWRTCPSDRGLRTASNREDGSLRQLAKNDRQPVTQTDFSFASTENDLAQRTNLNATDIQTGYGMSLHVAVERDSFQQ